MANIASYASYASYRQRVFVILFSATAGVMGAFAACTDSYRGDPSNGLSTGPSSGGGGAGGNTGAAGGLLGEGGMCEETCSNDLKKVVNCLGTVIKECTPDQGCANADCIPNPCEAAEKSQSSYGCDYWALKTALRPSADGACFAAIVANTWQKSVQIEVERDGQRLQVERFTYIPRGQGAIDAIEYDPYDPAAGLAQGQVAILFLSRRSLGASVVDCPKDGALDLETGVVGTGRGSAFHIKTDYPVVAYQMLPYGGGQAAITSATLLLPTSAWQNNYVAINAYSSSAPALSDAYPSLDIVAKENDTEVTILPKVAITGSADVMPAPANVPMKYTLDAGEFLQVTQPAELSGSPISSNKPIGVFGAHTCMLVPGNVQDCDSAQQQIAPVSAMGNEYVAVRYRDRVAGRVESPPWRIVGMVDGTALTWSPSKPAGAPDTINLGQVIEFNAGDSFVAKSQNASHPFYLGGYMTGGEPYALIGDPEWVNVIPPSQYLNYYAFFTDPTYPETSLVVIRTPSKVNGSFADVELDCAGKVQGWQPIGKYEYARVDLVTGNFQGVSGCANGLHEMSSELPFGVTVWGWGAIQQNYRVSYAYPAGAGFQPINEVVVPPSPR